MLCCCGQYLCFRYCLQVQGGLRLIGADAVYLASSGTLVTRLDQLQDSVETYIVKARGLLSCA